MSCAVVRCSREVVIFRGMRYECRQQTWVRYARRALLSPRVTEGWGEGRREAASVAGNGASCALDAPLPPSQPLRWRHEMVGP